MSALAAAAPVRAPALHYPGSKWGIAPWVISHMPAHEAYVEPFFGSGAVLLRKPRVRAEVANDLDGKVISFFRALRERPTEIAAAVALTPYARDELELAKLPPTGDLIEDARRFLVACWQTRGGPLGRRHPGWRFDMHGASNRSLAGTWAMLPDRLLAVAERLRWVAFEHRPALEVLEWCRRSKGDQRATLIYADPPYVLQTRDNRLYVSDLTDQDHLELLAALDRHPGPVLLSAYPSPLYDERLRHWLAVMRSTRNQMNEARTEVLWLNPVAARGQLRLDLEGRP